MNLYMINNRGAVRGLSPLRVAEFEAQGWHLLPSQYLNEKGEPKQAYFPQYDEQLIGKTSNMIAEFDNVNNPILEVEVL